MPSASASAISSGSAGISSGDSSAMTVTSSTPARTAARATSSVVIIPRRGIVLRAGGRPAVAAVPGAGRLCRLAGLTRRRPQCRAGRVERHVSAADDDHPAPELDLEAAVDVEQELDGAQHPVELVTGQIQAPSPARADGEEQRLMARQQVSQRHVVTDAARELHVDAELQDGVDLASDDPARQSILGDAQHHHPSKPVGGLVDGDRMARQAQLVRRREAGGPTPDHADGRQRRRGYRAVRLVPDRVRGEAFDAEALRDEPLQGADCHRRVDGAAPARRLAGRSAHPAADRRERVGGPGDEIGVAVAPFGDGRDVGAGVGVDGAGSSARLVVP